MSATEDIRNELALTLDRQDTGSWDVDALLKNILHFMVHVVGKDPERANQRDWFKALVFLIRAILYQRKVGMERKIHAGKERRIYYLSMEFLIGRNLHRTLLDMDLLEPVTQALKKYDPKLSLGEIMEEELDAGLGNGGLGRLAACILDSMASQGYPGIGYGIRYEFGMFTQKIERGEQVELPEHWLELGNPWETERHSVRFPVRFGGRVITFRDDMGRECSQWVDTDHVTAVAYDVPLTGYRTRNMSHLRLWSAKASNDFDFRFFNEGNYINAVRNKIESENLSKVLYPNDNTLMGQELRLKQEYFFVSASLQDILRKFYLVNDRNDPNSIRELPNQVAIHLNDTHPSLAVVELARILIDQFHLSLEDAWEITQRTCSYTNHTLMSEALETWPIDLVGRILPRHLGLLYQINHIFLQTVQHRFPGDPGMLGRVSLFEDHTRRVRMANLSVIGSHKVNGVAELHTQLMQSSFFADFSRISPEKFENVTNGITQYRWLLQSNPGLSALLKERIGEGWITNLPRLKEVIPHVDDPAFRQAFGRIKTANKDRLAKLVKKRVGVDLDSQTMLFDVQVKRIHEYKRQLLNLLHVITRYVRIREGKVANPTPRAVIIGGKAAPGYHMAKMIIRLIVDVSNVINNDPAVRGQLKLVFFPNYNVSNAEVIIPGSDLSEQISTPGTEASGTGNMKFALNGALTIGTLDGANIEILREVGKDNIFIFGMTANDVQKLRNHGYNPAQHYEENSELHQVLDMIRDGFFCPDDPHRYSAIFDALVRGGDHFMLLADYAAYIACQEAVDRVYLNQDIWMRMAALNTANMGFFSIDRTVQTYARKIWKAQTIKA
ncbi:MAG: glycogen/starch/alpha-glucan phosphorylase [Magnetococcales bacterium]|nr:glycogen/starch/alpha-glucan phosphorylase [Magnetococcales bacterium]